MSIRNKELVKADKAARYEAAVQQGHIDYIAKMADKAARKQYWRTDATESVIKTEMAGSFRDRAVSRRTVKQQDKAVNAFHDEMEAMHKLGTWKTTTDEKVVVSISKSKKELLQTRKRNVLRIKDAGPDRPGIMQKQEPKPIVAKGFTGYVDDGGIIQKNMLDEETNEFVTLDTLLWSVVHNEARQPARLKQLPLTGDNPWPFIKTRKGYLGKRTNMERGQNVSMFSGARYLNWPTA